LNLGLWKNLSSTATKKSKRSHKPSTTHKCGTRALAYSYRKHEPTADLPSKWTSLELDALEKTLREHEAWLSERVEKQESVRSYEDPVIETTEMKARAKVLESHLQRLYKRKVPKVVKKPKPTTTTTTEVTKETEGTTRDEAASEEGPNAVDSDEQQQIPLEEEPGHDEL
jgi:hypoxia up-regulated 1